MPKKILTVTLNPAFQKIYTFTELTLGRVNRVCRLNELASGKGVNTARTLKTLGASQMVCGYVGGYTADIFFKNLKNIPGDFVLTKGTLRTCTTLIDKKNNTVTELCEPGAAISPSEKIKLHKKIDTHLKNATALILSGTIPKGEKPTSYFNFIQKANQLNVLSLLDAVGAPGQKGLTASPSIYKINKTELEMIINKKLSNERAIKKEIKKLSITYNVPTIIITNEAQPILAFADNTFLSVCPVPIHQKNPIGSGDAFNAGIIFHYLKNADIKEAIRFAAACGTANALTETPGTIRKKDVWAILKKTTLVESKN